MPRVLLTRPQGASEATAAALARDGFDCAIWPMTEIVFDMLGPEAFAGAGAYAFTSANGVQAAAMAAAPIRPAFCVGPATARAAKAAGFAPVRDADGDGAALARLCIQHAAAADGALLHIRGEEARVDVAAAVTAAGKRGRALVAYRAEPASAPPPTVSTAIYDGVYAVYAFYSPRSAAIFAELAESSWRKGLSRGAAVAISAATAEPLSGLGFRSLKIAARPNGAAMHAAICGAAT